MNTKPDTSLGSWTFYYKSEDGNGHQITITAPTFNEAVDACPFLTQPERDALKAKVQEIADDEDGYELYEIDVPEKED